MPNYEDVEINLRLNVRFDGPPTGMDWYRRRLPVMIEDWLEQYQDGRRPFEVEAIRHHLHAVVQLAARDALREFMRVTHGNEVIEYENGEESKAEAEAQRVWEEEFSKNRVWLKDVWVKMRP